EMEVGGGGAVTTSGVARRIDGIQEVVDVDDRSLKNSQLGYALGVNAKGGQPLLEDVEHLVHSMHARALPRIPLGDDVVTSAPGPLHQVLPL
ncbi:hypothetical protein PMAYCL1PPCAC_10948, partial [Pristionchus mayeri]